MADTWVRGVTPTAETIEDKFHVAFANAKAQVPARQAQLEWLADVEIPPLTGRKGLSKELEDLLLDFKAFEMLLRRMRTQINAKDGVKSNGEPITKKSQG